MPASDSSTDLPKSANGPAKILAVEDDDDVRVTYEIWLKDAWQVETAADGSEALEKLDESVDVVILDRMMPGLSGDEVLERIRERDLGCRVVMVTAVTPDYDIVEMPFDAYFAKPIERQDLNETVEILLERTRHDDRLQEYYSLVEKQATLEAEKPYRPCTTTSATSCWSPEPRRSKPNSGRRWSNSTRRSSSHSSTTWCRALRPRDSDTSSGAAARLPAPGSDRLALTVLPSAGEIYQP